MSESRELFTDEFGRIRVAVIAAPMLGGAEERLGDLGLLYRELGYEWVGNVFVVGPLFDPHANLSKGQRLRYLADHFPCEAGVTTHALVGRNSQAEAAMRAAGRTDWGDFTAGPDTAAAVVQLRRPDYPSSGVPLVFAWDAALHAIGSAAADDIDFAQYRALYPEIANGVIVVGGRRRHDYQWDGGCLLVSPGLFHGTELLEDPVGAVVLDLRVRNAAGSAGCPPGLTLDPVEYPCDFWDFNGTDLRRLAGC
jgi:hypothetical protein